MTAGRSGEKGWEEGTERSKKRGRETKQTQKRGFRDGKRRGDREEQNDAKKMKNYKDTFEPCLSSADDTITKHDRFSHFHGMFT